MLNKAKYSIIFLLILQSFHVIGKAIIFSTKQSENKFHFVSMGTLWKVEIGELRGRSVNIEFLYKKCSEIVGQYDIVFSDWSGESELSLLTKGKNGLKGCHKTSALFIEGLKWSKLAYLKSNTLFNISIYRSPPYNLNKVILKDKEFCSEENFAPLSFGGIVKGMALGAVADFLISSKIRNFYINAGGGNLAFMGYEKNNSPWPEFLETGLKVVDELSLYGISRSRTISLNGQDIVSPSALKKTNELDKSVVLWRAFKEDQWGKLAGLMGLLDAASTTFLLKNDSKSKDDFLKLFFNSL